MTQRKADPVEHQSTNPLDERMEQLRQLFPEAVSEDGIDFDILRNLLGIEFPQKERYNFTWAGKQEAILSLQRRSKATLKPAPEESVNWDTTQHLFIEGDNLEVLKLLYRPYFGLIKLIYIDPPYNTGNDFVYPDNYSEPLTAYLKLTGQMDKNGEVQTTAIDKTGRKHSSWLSMMYSRIFLARQLLAQDGIIFISVDDNEVANLRLMMNEILGEENFIAQIIWKKSYGGGSKAKYVVGLHEYILCYARNLEKIPLIELPPDPKTRKYYTQQDEKFETRGPFRTQPLATTSMDDRPNLQYAIHWNGEEIWPDKQWQWSEERVLEAIENNELVFNQSSDGKWTVHYKQYLYDEDGKERGAKPYSVLEGPYTQQGTKDLISLIGEGKVFTFPKPVELIKHLINYIHLSKDALVLDFFAGSATTAQAILELNREQTANRRFIMVQLPEITDNPDFPTIADIGKKRISRVINRMMDENNGKLDGFEEHPTEDLGFRVFKLSKSPMRQWEELPADKTSPEDYARQMELFVTDPLLDGWTEQDVIAEVAIKEAGFSLTYRVEKVEAVANQSVYKVVDDEKGQHFYICLDDRITLEALKPLALTRDDLLIFRDSAITDTIAANLALTCRIKSI